MKVYTIGAGVRGEAPMPVKDNFGNTHKIGVLGIRRGTAPAEVASIHRNERKGDAPSDHVPVVVDLDVATEDDDDRPMIF